jgi:hypothetical protein
MDSFKRFLYRFMVRFAKDDQQLLLSRIQMLDSRRQHPDKTPHIDRLLEVCDEEILRRSLRHGSRAEAEQHLKATQELSEGLLGDDETSRAIGETFFGKDWRRRYLPFEGETAPRSSAHQGSPTPQFLGDFLAYQLVSERFGLNTQQLTSVLPANIRDVAQIWLLFYLAWLFQLAVAKQHGRDFRDRMLQAARSRLLRANQVRAEFGDELVAATDTWFSALDRATGSIGTTIEGTEVPFEVFAAMTFLVTDASSPYYQRTSLPDHIEFDLAEVLASSVEQRREYIQQAAGLRFA